MTPSPSSCVGLSRGWTRRPGSPSGTRSSRATRSRRGCFRAWRDLRSLRDPDRFDAWLYKLTVNACLDQARRRRRRPIEVEIPTLHAPADSDPAGTLADRELVDGVLRRLDESSRSIVVLHSYLGLPLTEVVVALRIPVGTVKSRLHRALGEMRTEIGTDPSTSPSPVAGGTLA